MSDKLFYRKKEVCRILGVARATIDRWTHDENYRHVGFPQPGYIGVMAFWKPTEIHEFADRLFKHRDTVLTDVGAPSPA